MKPSAIIFTLILTSSLQALACPETLSHVHSRFLGALDVCATYDLYQDAVNQLKQKNIQPAERIANLRAPRFIQLKTWVAQKKQFNGSPLLVYKPAPLTWQMWDVGAQFVDQDVQRNFSTATIHALNEEWLKEVHGASLKGLIPTAGKFREAGEYGLVLHRAVALNPREFLAATEVEYPMITRPERLVQFRHTQCFEDRDEAFKRSLVQHDRNSAILDPTQWPVTPWWEYSYLGKNKVPMQCGYLVYPPPEEIQPQLASWLSFINKATADLTSQNPTEDPVAIAARAQRWFVSIHPYTHGNGRVSRFVMDWVLESIGLPPPILKDMGKDLYSNEQQWAKQIGQGILRTIHTAQFCAQNPEGLGCKTVEQ